MQKSKLSIDDQISYMKNTNGLLFNIIDEEKAKSFLLNNNYYFKFKSYAKNYDKYKSGPKKGKYINLEFAFLQELSTIDMHLRKFIIKITLDIEHFLKIKLLRDFSENDQEDGYELIKELFKKYPEIEKNIDYKSKYSVCSDLILKYKDNFAIWNIVEVLSFGDFIKLYELYYEKYNSVGSMKNYLWSVKFLRNAAAHNNCLINSLKNPYTVRIRGNKEVNTLVSKIEGISPDVRKKKMDNPVIHDFVVTLFLFNNIVTSHQIKKYIMNELKELFDSRFIRNKIYFEKNQIICSYYRFGKIIVDYFHEKCI